MTDTRITSTGLEASAAHLRRLETAHAAASQAVIRPLGEAYQAQLITDTPRGEGEQPGRLRAGYRSKASYGPTQSSYQITNDTPHLKYVLQGRGPVVATRGRALRFVIRGQVFYRKRVGAADPNPFPDRTRRTMAPRIQQASSDLAGAMIRIAYGSA